MKMKLWKAYMEIVSDWAYFIAPSRIEAQRKATKYDCQKVKQVNKTDPKWRVAKKNGYI